MSEKAIPTSPVLAPAKEAEYNRIGVNYHTSIARPPVQGTVIDFHNHLLAAKHARVWFETAKHYGIDAFMSMSPLEEAVTMLRDWPGRIHFIAVPKWGPVDYDDWMRRIDAFYNLGSRLLKFHLAPGTMESRKYDLRTPQIQQIIRHAVERGMIIMTHVGDPQTWYDAKYADHARFGTREQHYQMWEEALEMVRPHPWIGAHLGGNPEDLGRLQSMLDRFPHLNLDCSATRWMVREISKNRDQAREFFIRNQDRILFGSDQVSVDDRGFDFLASRWWSHRKLWESDYDGPAPIFDPDLPEDAQPRLRGLSLPPDVLQKLYHDNATKLLARVGIKLYAE